MSPLLNVWNFFGKFWKKHRGVQKQTFQQVSEIFEILRKFSEVVGNFGKLENVTKCSRRPSSILKFCYEIFGNHWKSSDIFGNLRKSSESSQNDLPTFFWEYSEIFGSVQKCSENFGNPRKIFECNWKFTINFYSVPI